MKVAFEKMKEVVVITKGGKTTKLPASVVNQLIEAFRLCPDMTGAWGPTPDTKKTAKLLAEALNEFVKHLD